MLQKLRDQTQSAGFKIVVAVLVFALAFFGFGAFNVFAPGDPTVASVNGEDITQDMLLGEAERYRRRLLNEFSDQLTTEDIDPLALQATALEGMISRKLLGQIAGNLGLAASAAQIDAAVLADPGFQVDGAFNQDLYRRGLAAMGYAPTDYLAELAMRMSSDQLRRGIADTVFATSWEASAFVRLIDQQRDLAWLSFTVSHFSEGVEVDEADIALHYQEHEAEMMSEEKVDAVYVELAWEQMQEDPSIEITDDDLMREYEASKAEAGDGERRRSAHILLRTGEDRTEAEAVAELEAIKQRLAAGEPFSALAEAHSEDPGSASAGGDLGAAGRGVFDPAFEQALWELEEGEVSSPVKSAFGYHLIRLESIEAVEFPSFDQQKDGIGRRLRRAAARELFTDGLRELDNLAFEQNDSLAGLAEAFGLEQQRIDGVTRTKGAGVFGQSVLREAIFAADVLDDGNNTAAIEYEDGRAVVARVVGHHLPQLRPLEDVQPEIEAILVQRAAREALRAAHQSALARLRAGEAVAAVADSHGLAWRTLERVHRNDSLAPLAVLDAGFALPRPPEDGKSIGVASLGDEGEAIVILTRVVEGDASTLADSEVESLRQLYQSRGQGLDFEALYQTYKADADISHLDLPSG